MKSVLAVMFLSLLSAIVVVYTAIELQAMEQTAGHLSTDRASATDRMKLPQDRSPERRAQAAQPPLLMPNPLRPQ